MCYRNYIVAHNLGTQINEENFIEEECNTQKQTNYSKNCYDNTRVTKCDKSIYSVYIHAYIGVCYNEHRCYNERGGIILVTVACACA
jgi:hypothetical protein